MNKARLFGRIASKTIQATIRGSIVPDLRTDLLLALH